MDLFQQLGVMLPAATRMALAPPWRWILGFSALDALLMWKEGRLPPYASRALNALWFLLALASPAILIGVMYLPMINRVHALE